MHAASLNPADVKHRDGALKYLVNRDMPVVFGFDFSGVIVSIGSGMLSSPTFCYITLSFLCLLISCQEF